MVKEIGVQEISTPILLEDWYHPCALSVKARAARPDNGLFDIVGTMGEQLSSYLDRLENTPEESLALLAHDFGDPFKTLKWLDGQVAFFIEEYQGCPYQDVTRTRALELKRICEEWLSAIQEGEKGMGGRHVYDPVRTQQLIQTEKECSEKADFVGGSLCVALDKLIEWKSEEEKKNIPRSKRKVIQSVRNGIVTTVKGEEYSFKKKNSNSALLCEKVYGYCRQVGDKVEIEKVYPQVWKGAYSSDPLVNWKRVNDAVGNINKWGKTRELPPLLRASKTHIERLA